MKPVGALLLLLAGGRRVTLDRGLAALQRAEGFHGSARLRFLDRAIDAFSRLRNARLSDPQATALLAEALLAKAVILPVEARPPVRARAVAALNDALRRAGRGQGDARVTLSDLLARAWAPLPDEPQDTPEARARLVRARDAQALALAACPADHPARPSMERALAQRNRLLALHPQPADPAAGPGLNR